MVSDIIIISAGKLAREVFCWAEDAIAAGKPWRMKGFLDDRSEILAGYNYPAGILGDVASYRPKESDLFLCAIGDPRNKQKFCELVSGQGGRFATLVHPSAVVGRNVALGPGVIIAPHALLTSDINVGECSYVGPQCGCSHDNNIGKWCQISGGSSVTGGVTIEDLCFVGVNSAILPNVKIGRGAYIGAGSIVLRNVKSGEKVFGNPAVPIGLVE